MSEETLQRLIDRLNGDASFRERAQTDPEHALTEFGLGALDQVGLRSGSEEGLRRLAGTEVRGFVLPVVMTPPVANPHPLKPMPTYSELQPGCSPYPVTVYPRCK